MIKEKICALEGKTLNEIGDFDDQNLIQTVIKYTEQVNNEYEAKTKDFEEKLKVLRSEFQNHSLLEMEQLTSAKQRPESDVNEQIDGLNSINGISAELNKNRSRIAISFKVLNQDLTFLINIDAIIEMASLIMQVVNAYKVLEKAKHKVEEARSFNQPIQWLQTSQILLADNDMVGVKIITYDGKLSILPIDIEIPE